MSAEQDPNSIKANGLAKPSRRTRDDSYTALREAAERRRIQNRIAQRNSRRRTHERKAQMYENMTQKTQQEESNSSSTIQPNTQREGGQHAYTNPNSESDAKEYNSTASGSGASGGTESANNQSSEMDVGGDNELRPVGHQKQNSWPIPYTVGENTAIQDPQAAINTSLLFQNDYNYNTTTSNLAFQRDSRSAPFPSPPEDFCHPQLEFPLLQHDLLSMPLHDSRVSPTPNMLSTHSMHQIAETDMRMNAQLPRSSAGDSMSARLQIVLDCIQSVGFTNFDELATSYYTEKFDSNSAADIEQKISRSRRLRDFLASLRQNSKRWTRWESRGYDREIIESAEEMYVEELQKLVNRLNGDKITSHPRTESGYATSASDMSDDSNFMNLMMTTDDNTQLKGNMPQESPMGMARFYQNELPNIWALLMELAGHNGPKSELAVVTVVSILCNSRKNPELTSWAPYGS